MYLPTLCRALVGRLEAGRTRRVSVSFSGQSVPFPGADHPVRLFVVWYYKVLYSNAAKCTVFPALCFGRLGSSNESRRGNVRTA